MADPLASEPSPSVVSDASFLKLVCFIFFYEIDFRMFFVFFFLFCDFWERAESSPSSPVDFLFFT